jgi:hypothetical protein
MGSAFYRFPQVLACMTSWKFRLFRWMRLLQTVKHYVHNSRDDCDFDAA